MKKVVREVGKINRKPLQHAKRADVMADRFEGEEGPIDSRHLLISLMLPPAVKMFLEECEREVEALCGSRYGRDGENVRWGVQKGSIVLAEQHVAIERPRVRTMDGREVGLATYRRFQDPELFEGSVFDEGLKNVSQRNYKRGLKRIAASFGFSKSQVSRKWIKATAKKIDELQKRSLKELDIAAVFIDGKRFRSKGVIVALGVSSTGRKYVLGIYQADTENHLSCLSLLSDLESRGLPREGLLFVVDGGSGLNCALNKKYACDDKEKRSAVRIRCFVHKWWNLEKALGDASHEAAGLFWAMRAAKNLAEAKALSENLESVLRKHNLSALESYREAKEDLLVIHELRLSQSLKRFFSTTNAIESLNSLVEEDMRRVKRWKDSEHFQRWLATYCLHAEKKMRRINGHSGLGALWITLRTMVSSTANVDSAEQVA
jgi:putative transposase